MFSFHTQRLQNGYSKHLREQFYLLYHSASIPADEEHQHMARECCSVTNAAFFIEIVLTYVKEVNHS